MHIPVLLEEVLEGLAIEPDDIVLDATAGAGGHSEAICKKLGPLGRLVALDADREALARVRTRLATLAPSCSYQLVNSNFRHLDRALEEAGVPAITKALFDVGLSSDQLEQSGRGFSFDRDEPLVMTFGADGSGATYTARDIVNEWDEASIADILYYYGEERSARRIARTIVEARKSGPIETTSDLVRLIEIAVPKRGRSRPAAKTFQALRIAVNDEIEALREGLDKAYAVLAEKGRMAVIAFHSLEDRVVKRFMKEKAAEGGAREILKKPVTPTLEERRANPRSRSAKLRILEKK